MTLAASSIVDILPLEIIDNTIDIIAADDRKAFPFLAPPNIEACSLTCRAFLPRSKHHIFRSITICYLTERSLLRSRNTSHVPETIPRAKSFAKLLSSSPGISDLVQELRYIVPGTEASLPYLVPNNFQTLTKLKTFVLSGHKQCALSWFEISPPSQFLFTRLMKLPSVTHLRITSVTRFPPVLLFHCTNLQSLHLDRVTFDEDDVSKALSTSLSHSIKPKNLVLKLEHSMSTMLSQIARKTTQDGEPVFDLADLQNFDLEIYDPLIADIISKVLRRASNLESIRLLVKPSYHTLESGKHPVTMDQIICLLIPSFPTLKYLTLHVIADADQEQLLEQISRALNGIAAQGIWVSRLTIQIRLGMDIACPEFLYLKQFGLPRKGSEWDLFEHALLTAGHWPALKRVEFEIFSYGCNAVWEKEFSDFIQMWWNRALRRAKVGIDFDFFVS